MKGDGDAWHGYLSPLLGNIYDVVIDGVEVATGEDMSDIRDVLKAAGLWEQPVANGNLNTVRAFYNREWVGQCSLDDICDLAIKYDCDPRKLVAMAEAAGEYVWD